MVRILALCALLVMACHPADRGYPAWRAPSRSELQGAWRNGASDRYARVSADFDGDGRDDLAAIMISTDGHRLAIWVFLASDGRRAERVLLLEELAAARIEREGIAIAQPGHYKTACSKGYPCGKEEPDEIVLAHPGIKVFSYEGPERIYFYDHSAAAFRAVWLSD